MKKLLLIFAFFVISSISFLALTPTFTKTANAASCSVSPGSNFSQGGQMTINANNFGPGPLPVRMIGVFSLTTTDLAILNRDPFTVTITISSSQPLGNYRVYVDAGGFGKVFCTPDPISITASGGGGGGTAGIGTITPPSGVPKLTGDPTNFVAGIIRNGLTLLVTIAFIVDLLWTIFAGYRFITAGGDPKTVSSAWSQIYWGLIGMLVVLGSFAIIKIAEIFFSVSIIQNFQIPTQ